MQSSPENRIGGFLYTKKKSDIESAPTHYKCLIIKSLLSKIFIPVPPPSTVQ